MAHVTDERTGQALDGSTKGVLGRIVSGFVSLTNHFYRQAKHRLPVTCEHRPGDPQSTNGQRLADAALKTEWDLERNERSDSRGYLSPEHYHYMYY